MTFSTEYYLQPCFALGCIVRGLWVYSNITSDVCYLKPPSPIDVQGQSEVGSWVVVTSWPSPTRVITKPIRIPKVRNHWTSVYWGNGHANVSPDSFMFPSINKNLLIVFMTVLYCIKYHFLRTHPWRNLVKVAFIEIGYVYKLWHCYFWNVQVLNDFVSKHNFRCGLLWNVLGWVVYRIVFIVLNISYDHCICRCNLHVKCRDCVTISGYDLFNISLLV